MPPDVAPLRVVSNTTPISELAKAGRLELLHDVYGVVLIPSEVRDELAAGSHPAAAVVRSAGWIQARAVSDPTAVQALHAATGLGLGEYGAILLAEELGAERWGREWRKRCGRSLPDHNSFPQGAASLRTGLGTAPLRIT